LGPLVIKASAGTVFRAPIIHCDELDHALPQLKRAGFGVAMLEAGATQSLFDYQPFAPTVFVFGSESDGVSQGTRELTDTRVSIPMQNGVESLNVAVTAALVAFHLSSTKS
jgi:23S rRNA (guanosine2251-2'-O)-methyltransferase